LLSSLSQLLSSLAQALGGDHHHHHHGRGFSDAPASSDRTTSSSNAGGVSSNTRQTVNQLRSSLFQTNNSSQSKQNTALNPAAIIFNTLSSAGINVSNSPNRT
jgi:hypothetical protein